MAISRRALFGLAAGAAVAPMIGQPGPHRIIAGLRQARGGAVRLKPGFVGERGPEFIVRAYAGPVRPNREGGFTRAVNIVS